MTWPPLRTRSYICELCAKAGATANEHGATAVEKNSLLFMPIVPCTFHASWTCIDITHSLTACQIYSYNCHAVRLFSEAPHGDVRGKPAARGEGKRLSSRSRFGLR